MRGRPVQDVTRHHDPAYAVVLSALANVIRVLQQRGRPVNLINALVYRSKERLVPRCAKGQRPECHPM
jgi:hypothetical protein